MLVKRVVLLLLAAPFLVTTDYMVADIFTKALQNATLIANYGGKTSPSTQRKQRCIQHRSMSQQ